jgi:hypothetical protein
MRSTLLLLLLLATPAAAAPVATVPVEGIRDGLGENEEWPVVFQGGPTRTLLGRSRVRWGSPERELFFTAKGAKRRYVMARDTATGKSTRVATIPSPPGGEPRVYLSDRDDLAALTVDHGTWDTCPEIRALRPGGTETILLPCPEAGQAALTALQEAGHVPGDQDARARMRFRLTNLRYVEPGFLAEGGVELDAELRLITWSTDPKLIRARFVLRDGRIQSCRLLD